MAVAHSTSAAAVLLKKIKRGEADYHFIEVMCCSGGCVSGGGQPHVLNKDMLAVDIRKERAKAIYAEDESRQFRKSHKNPDVKKLYESFLEEPNSLKSHELLHTTYAKREKYPNI